MNKIILILIVFILGTIFNCKENFEKNIAGNDNKVSQKVLNENLENEYLIQQISHKLDILARNMAFALSKQGVLQKLQMKFFNVSNKFKILDLERWMNTTISGKTIIQIMAESGNTENINGQFKTISESDIKDLVKSLNFKIDIYFPIKEHQSAWFENRQNLLVAYVNPADEWAPVNAYGLNGEKKILDPNNPTSDEEPVLVIIPCEHHGIHYGNFNKIMAESEPPDDPGEGSGGNYTQPYRLYLEDMYIEDNSEPVYAEPAEIYFKVKYVGENYWQETETPWADEDGQWYTDKFLTIFSSYSYGTEWLVEVWEMDDYLLGGDDHLESFDVYSGINLGAMLNGVNDYVDCRFTTYHP
ncbi:hypothetical protein ACX8XP_03965 [Calditrichota bacterium LG25]